MKYIFSVLLLSQIAFAQEVKSPGVLVLTPMDFVLDKSLESESKEYQLNMTDEQVAECISIKNTNEDREYVKKMNEVECEFTRHSDIATSFTYYTYGWLTFKLYGTFDDAILYPKKGQEKREIQDYEKLSEEYGTNWIVNIKTVNFKSKSDKLSGEVSFELWNKNVGEIVQSETIEIDSINRGMEMSCDDGKLGCLVTNGSIFTATEILKTMYSEEKYWR